MKISLLRLFVVLTLMLLPGLVFSASLSEGEAKRVIEEGFGRADVIPLGTYAVGGAVTEGGQTRPTNLRLRYLSSDAFAWVQAWAKVGVISVSSNKTLGKQKEFSSKEFMDYTKGGADEYVVIAPTEKGLRIGKKKTDVVEFLSIPDTTKYEVTKVQKMEDKKYGNGEYKVVYCSYEANWSPMFLELQKAEGLHQANKRKAIVLLTYDPLKQSWSFVTADHADSDKKFTTQDVETALSRIKR